MHLSCPHERITGWRRRAVHGGLGRLAMWRPWERRGGMVAWWEKMRELFNGRSPGS